MSKLYEKLDLLIITAVSKGNRNPRRDLDVFAEAQRIANTTRQYTMRVIDGRLTALRKSGAIHYLHKSDAPDGKVGWYVVSTGQPA